MRQPTFESSPTSSDFRMRSSCGESARLRFGFRFARTCLPVGSEVGPPFCSRHSALSWSRTLCHSCSRRNARKLSWQKWRSRVRDRCVTWASCQNAHSASSPLKSFFSHAKRACSASASSRLSIGRCRGSSTVSAATIVSSSSSAPFSRAAISIRARRGSTGKRDSSRPRRVTRCFVSTAPSSCSSR